MMGLQLLDGEKGSGWEVVKHDFIGRGFLGWVWKFKFIIACVNIVMGI